MTQVGTMVKVIKGRHKGKKGRLIAIFLTDDGMTLVVKTPDGVVNIDIPAMIDPIEYLATLPKRKVLYGECCGF